MQNFKKVANDAVEAFCPKCRGVRMFAHRPPRHLGVNLLLVVLTCGLWALVWFFETLFSDMRPWRCVDCAWHKPVFYHHREAIEEPVRKLALKAIVSNKSS